MNQITVRPGKVGFLFNKFPCVLKLLGFESKLLSGFQQSMHYCYLYLIYLQTHPSVRIKGTENNFEPVLCVHPKCADKAPHMHCPFCVKTEIYPDPVILKAHYRVKHVDKGLDFAGKQLTDCLGICVALLRSIYWTILVALA